MHRALRIDTVDRVVTGRGGPGDVQITVGGKGEMIGANARLKRGKDEGLTALGDLEDRAAAITHIKVAGAIKGNAGGHPHARGELRHSPVRGHAIDGAVISRAYV